MADDISPDTGDFQTSTGQNWPEEESRAILQSLQTGQDQAEDDRESIEKKIEKLKQNQENIQDLKRKNRELEKQLQNYQYSVPLPVYGALIGGVILSIAGYEFANDIIYSTAGIFLILISLAAIVESKFRGNRTQ